MPTISLGVLGQCDNSRWVIPTIIPTYVHQVPRVLAELKRQWDMRAVAGPAIGKLLNIPTTALHSEKATIVKNSHSGFP